jgi:hypothetical protein
MNRIAIAACALAFFAAPALADDPLSDDEATKAKAAAAAWGCEGGKWEKETEGTGLYELDDAKCKDGAAYDLKFDKDYKLMAIIRD